MTKEKGKELRPLAIGADLSSSQSPSTPAEHAFMADKPYREAVKSIQHAANTARPDIAYSVNLLAAFLQNPGPAHWRAVQHLLAFLKGTLDYKVPCMSTSARRNGRI